LKKGAVLSGEKLDSDLKAPRKGKKTSGVKNSRRKLKISQKGTADGKGGKNRAGFIGDQ